MMNGEAAPCTSPGAQERSSAPLLQYLAGDIGAPYQGLRSHFKFYDFSINLVFLEHFRTYSPQSVSFPSSKLTDVTGVTDQQWHTQQK